MKTLIRTVACLTGLIALNQSPAAEVPDGFRDMTLVEGINAATAMTVAPDGRIFIAEQTGRILVYKHDALRPRPALDLSGREDDYWERGLIGLTLHPDFPRTPWLFVLYVAKSPFPHHVVGRFNLLGDTVDPASEFVLLEGDDQSKLGGGVPWGHQGGPIRIGPDGKVYVGLGEQTNGEAAQSLGTLQGKILRLNADGSIPEDNPFADSAAGKYRAIWAYGIRNPFGLAFRPGTGELWETEVGASSFEEVNVIRRGGNYGWPRAEGMSRDERFINPLHAYAPVVGRSITGAAFCPVDAPPESRFPVEWRGKFFFADWAANWVRALDPDAPGEAIPFAKGFNNPVALAFEGDGSLLVLNRGTIWRDGKKFKERSGSLVRVRFVAKGEVPPRLDRPAFPRRLEDSGLLEIPETGLPVGDFLKLEPNVPNVPPGVVTEDYLKVPPGGKIGFAPHGEWRMPEGAVALHHFRLAGGPHAGKIFETHVAWFTGPRTVRAAAYRWSMETGASSLVDDGDMITLPGTERQWFTPGVEYHLDLDSVIFGFSFPLNTRQLNHNGAEGRSSNLLTRMADRGWLDPAAVAEPDTLPRLVSWRDEQSPLESRIRSYLDVHCAMCHRPGGLGRGLFDARWETPLAEQGLIHGPLMSGDLGIAGAKIVVPGSPSQSILLDRLTRRDNFHMPPVDLNPEEAPIIPVLRKWIAELGR